MKPRTLEEFAEELRRKGDFYEMEFADEILALVDIEEEVAEPYSDICADIELYAADYSNPTDAIKALEWIGDRSNLLKELEEKLENTSYADCDVDDALKEMLGTLEEAEDILRANGWDGDGHFLEALQALADRVPPATELTYDL